MAPEYVLLGLLYSGPSHGYELHQRLTDEFGNIWHTSQSQTYNILKRLEARGYISSTIVEQEKLPPRQQLHITEAGARRFEKWLNTPTKSSVHAIRVEFVTRLYFMQLYSPKSTEEMIQDQAEVVRLGLQQLEDKLVKLPADQTFNRLALELRIILLNSAFSWLKNCQQMFSVDQGIREADE